jgi:superfamily II DNA/RNA helicase
MKKSIELLAADVVNWPVRITAGDQSSANEDIVQEVIVVKDDEEKWEWLSKHVGHLTREGKMLIFANQKQ